MAFCGRWGFADSSCPLADYEAAWQEAARREATSAITLKAQTLAELMFTQRHYVGDADGAYDPRFKYNATTQRYSVRRL